MAQTVKRRMILIWALVAGLVGTLWAGLRRLIMPDVSDISEKRGKPMEKLRHVKTIVRSRPTTEGAGVRLERIFGFGTEADFDPFLLLDHFGSDKPEEYLAGFPWHPHRGMETITYVLEGEVEHQDSLGNKGTIHAGDIQWMTAGSGIIHQEMPKGDADGRMYGFNTHV